MKKTLALIALLMCSACETRIVYRDPPEIPELPPKIKDKCPGLDDVPNRSIAALSAADVSASYLYAKCQARGDGAVTMYEAARTARTEYMKKKAEAENKNK